MLEVGDGSKNETFDPLKAVQELRKIGGKFAREGDSRHVIIRPNPQELPPDFLKDKDENTAVEEIRFNGEIGAGKHVIKYADGSYVLLTIGPAEGMLRFSAEGNLQGQLTRNRSPYGTEGEYKVTGKEVREYIDYLKKL